MTYAFNLYIQAKNKKNGWGNDLQVFRENKNLILFEALSSDIRSFSSGTILRLSFWQPILLYICDYGKFSCSGELFPLEWLRYSKFPSKKNWWTFYGSCSKNCRNIICWFRPFPAWKSASSRIYLNIVFIISKIYISLKTPKRLHRIRSLISLNI